jgi:GH15 family glucan-1,4-alpha-glucosidase
MYRSASRHPCTRRFWSNLEGYKGSSPVRIGNDATGQLQLDIYGEFLDAVYLYNQARRAISYDLWQKMRRLLNWLCDNWRRPDEGIWSLGAASQQNVYSKVMCWVALDRGARLAEKALVPFGTRAVA